MKQQEEQGLDKRIQRGKKELLNRVRKAKKRSDQTQGGWLDHMLKSNKKIGEKIVSIEHKIESIKSNISHLEYQLRTEQNDLKYTKEVFDWWLEALKNCKKSFSDHKKELKRLMKLPHILAVEIVHNALRVYTDTIYITQDSKQYEIGAFEITLNLKFDFIDGFDSITDSLTFKNITNTNSMRGTHPYIEDEYFCFGDLGCDIETALKHQDFVLAFIYILQALQNGEGDFEYLVPEWKEVAYGAR